MTQLPITVAALYRFARFDEPGALRARVQARCEAEGIKGTLIFAAEGVNGTIAGSSDGIDAIIAELRSLPGCAELEVKYSAAESMPFYRLKVVLKREIVSFGVDGIDPIREVGTYVDALEWNALIADPNTVVIDTRNGYEVGIGTFAGAVDPKTETFRDFPEWFRANRDQLLANKTRVAMFCTGGIRCEKSTAFLKSEGIHEVFHLDGGILKYLETVPAEQSLWEGECFVFDQRVSVRHGLELGTYGRCHGCRNPLSASDMESPQYVEGVSCPHCHGARSERDRARFAERQKQVRLAEQRGEQHVGVRRDPS